MECIKMKNTNRLVKKMREAALRNGWDIVASSVSLGDQFTVPSCFVLVKRDSSIAGREYSTHEFANGHFFWGHYDLTADQARSDYYKRSGHWLGASLTNAA
jgi:hypothetical protein